MEKRISITFLAVDVELVNRLAIRDPEYSTPFSLGSNATRQSYFNPAFGWHIATSCARARVAFPETVLGRDHWLFRAYLWQVNQAAYPAPHVAEAAHLSRLPIANTLKAMLITGLGDPPAKHLDLVAAKTGIPRPTVEAYEILFFNVLDRPSDEAYLSSIVYPEGRLVEYDEDYFETAAIPDLILRAAYSHRGIELVERLAGMRGANYAEEMQDRRDYERELEQKFMGTALVMASCGYMNQRSPAIQRATTLLAAGRSSRNQPQAETTPSGPNSSALDLAAALNLTTPAPDSILPRTMATSPSGSTHPPGETVGENVVNTPEPSPALSPADSVMPFSESIQAIWSNKDFDKPVTLVAKMSSPGFPDHYLTAENTGVPVSEVRFEIEPSSGI